MNVIINHYYIIVYKSEFQQARCTALMIVFTILVNRKSYTYNPICKCIMHPLKIFISLSFCILMLLPKLVWPLDTNSSYIFWIYCLYIFLMNYNISYTFLFDNKYLKIIILIIWLIVEIFIKKTNCMYIYI